MKKNSINFINERKNRKSKIYLLLILSLVTFPLISCSEITAPADVFPPDSPKNFILIGGGDGQVHFRWEKNTEIDIQAYQLYRSINNIDSFKLLASLNQTEFLDRFLEYDSTYYYYLTAIDFAGNESLPTNIIDIQPLNLSAPQPPSRLLVQGYNNSLLGALEVGISWIPPDIGDLKNYMIYRGLDSSFVPDVLSFLDSTDIAIYVDKSVQINQRYYYKITAVDKGFKISLPSKAGTDIILSSPILVSPANNSRFGDPRTFKFEAVSNAVNYEVFVGNGPFSDVFWSSGKITNTEISYNGAALESSRVYYWWVGVYSKDKNKFEDGTEFPAQVNSYSLVNNFFAE